MNKVSSVDRFFSVFSSVGATLSIVGVLVVLSCFGLFIPQGTGIVPIAHTYPPSVVQVVQALDLHQLGQSWLLRSVVLILFLNLFGMLLRRALEPSGIVQSESNSSVGASSPSSPKFDGPSELSVVAVLRLALPRWTAYPVGSGPQTAYATRGFLKLGLGIAFVGILGLCGAWLHWNTWGVEARVWIMTGDFNDRSVQSRFRVSRLQSDSWIPWKPDFGLSCTDTLDGRVLGERKCSVFPKGAKKQNYTLAPGHYVSIKDVAGNDYRLTLVGARRLSGVGNFSLDVELGSELSRTAATVGRVYDVLHDGKVLSALLVSGNSKGDPLAIVSANGGSPQSMGEWTATSRAREELEFRMATYNHEWIVWLGMGLLLAGMIIVFVFPSYQLTASRTDSQWEISVNGSGLLARTDVVLASAQHAISTRQGQV